MKIGTFVCPIEDDKHTCPAMVVYDHVVADIPGLSTIKWMSDGHISLRDDKELQELTAEEFCMSWCRDQIGYP